MGLIGRAMEGVFGSGSTALRETVEVFRENAEAGAARAATHRRATLEQFAAEFEVARQGRFDRFMDGVNRIPRPAMALGTLGLFVAAMVSPVWFSARMEGLALVPEPLWWLLGAIVSFYFGARYQVKGQEFRRTLVQTMAAAPPPAASPPPPARAAADTNHALDEWRSTREP